MSKFQIIKCKTCNTDFAAILTSCVDAQWYKKCAHHLETGNAIVYTADDVDFTKPLNKCCGKKLKPIKS